MKKIKLIIKFSIIFLVINVIFQNSFANTDKNQPKKSVMSSECQSLDEEIHNWEKDYSQNTQLLKANKQEIEKLSAEASSTKMKLTSETFIIAAKLETAQNWLKVKRSEKIKKNCPEAKKVTKS